ncbi:MAG: hypothetical protein COA78_24950 [Blastopirellula sp.]|nr:MAG: hypothetical protein COA78_24950 [Blastopirellula sp.]
MKPNCNSALAKPVAHEKEVRQDFTTAGVAEVVRLQRTLNAVKQCRKTESLRIRLPDTGTSNIDSQ